MRRAHLERLALVCPTCRVGGRGDSPLHVGVVLREEGDDIREGALVCRTPGCMREHPIIDGIPVVVADLMQWAQHQLDAALRRDDLSPWMMTLLSDAAGPGTMLDDERKNVSTYAGAHYAGEFPQLVDAALGLLPAPPRGLWLDLGASVGGGTFQLARAGADLAIGFDLGFAMLEVAERARMTGVARFEQRKVGLVYELREVPVERDPSKLGFVCADVTALPLADGIAQGALSINVVDCVPEPMNHLREVSRVIDKTGHALLSTPYDWAPSATAFSAWLGGHSQRGEHRGRSEPVLRAALTHPLIDLAVLGERERVTWRLPLTDRSTMEYAVHLLHLGHKQ